MDLTVYKGEILAVLGENGCGKTTLMNMISGIYYPDEGHIYVEGKEAVIRSPKDAFRYKIGMIHQHFKLVDVFTAAENITLGVNDGKKYSLKAVNDKVFALCKRYGFHIDPKNLPNYGMCTDLSRFYTFYKGEFVEFYPSNPVVEKFFLATE